MPEAEAAPPSLKTGMVLVERYRIVRELGRGGFGAVYRAWDSRLNKAVAVKENLETMPEAQRQFTREATVLANLSHPNLPRVTDHFTIPNQGQYLVMDYIEGEDLATRLKREGKVSLEQALGWINQVLDALVYLHTRKPAVIHRDIKPANIRIAPTTGTGPGRAVLVDFGLVKVTGPQSQTTIGARAVTPGFAPPEQYGRGHTDERTDIYALAATLYMLLTSQHPPDSVQRLAGSPLLPVHQFTPDLPVQVSQVIARAMALDADQRYQTAAEFKAALEESTKTAPRPLLVNPLPAPQPHVPALETPAAPPIPRTVAVDSPPGPLYSATPVYPPVQAPPYVPADIRPARRAARRPSSCAGRSLMVIGGVAAAFLLLGLIGMLAFWGYSVMQTSTNATGTAIGLALNATSTSQAQVTGTARTRLTATAHVVQVITAQAQATGTALAGAVATQSAKATATAGARETQVAAPQATESAWSALAASLGVNQHRTMVYGPESGSLVHNADDTSVVLYNVDVNLQDFVIEVRFYNPYSTSEGQWDYGIMLRHQGGNDQLRLTIFSDATWELRNVTGDVDHATVIHEGTIDNLDTSENGSNALLVICSGERGYFYVNGKPVATLDLSSRVSAGMIAMATGLWTGHEINGSQTQFANLIIWSLP
jgi:serine/threonine protein kinase